MSDGTLKNKLATLIESWRENGPPSSSEHIRIAEELLQWKKSAHIPGLWAKPPLMITATLDDGWGHGLKPIHSYAELAGIEILHLGLLCNVADIVAACRRHRPDLLGLTILQLDSLEDLEGIVGGIPTDTPVIVGGPIFKRCANDDWRERGFYAARDAAAFIHFLLTEFGKTS